MGKKRRKDIQKSISCSSNERKRRLKEEKHDVLPRNSGENIKNSRVSEFDRGKWSGSGNKTCKKLETFKTTKRKYSSSELSSVSSSDSEQERKKKRKHKKKKHRRQKREKQKKSNTKQMGNVDNCDLEIAVETNDLILGPTMPPQPKKRKPMVPMTKEEYEKQQSQMRRVYDPDTGRHRLVKGDGEIIEEAVSFQRHKEINKIATLGDGASFQMSLGLQIK